MSAIDEWLDATYKEDNMPDMSNPANQCSQWNDGHHWDVADTGDERPRVVYYWVCDCGATMTGEGAATEWQRRYGQ